MKGAYKRGNRWVSSMRVNGKTVTLGIRDTEIEAHNLYMESRAKFPAYNNSGTNHPLSVLTEEQIVEIREAVGTLKTIAQKYGVSPSYVWRIKEGQARKSG